VGYGLWLFKLQTGFWLPGVKLLGVLVNCLPPSPLGVSGGGVRFCGVGTVVCVCITASVPRLGAVDAWLFTLRLAFGSAASRVCPLLGAVLA